MQKFEDMKISYKKKILIPGSGVNVEQYTYSPKVNQNTITFTFIARIMKDKGIEEFIYASRKLTQKYKNIEIKIIGDYEEVEYKEIISDLCFSNNQFIHVPFTKSVEVEVSKSDCVVLPSYHEGMSNVLLEAAALGKAVIASNIPGCKEIIENNYNGFLVNKADSEDLLVKMEKYFNLDNEQKKIMGRNSRKKIEKEFNRKIIVNEYMKIIDMEYDKNEK